MIGDLSRAKVRWRTALCVAGLLGLVVCECAWAGRPEPEIGVTMVDPGNARTEDESLIIEVVNDVLVQSIQQSLRNEKSGYAWAARLPSIPADADLQELGREYSEQRGLKLLFAPKLSFTPRGSVLRVQAVDLSRSEHREWRWGGPVETAAMGREADFGQIEKRITEVAQSIVERATQGSRTTVLIWCIAPNEPLDPWLHSASRQFTLELPYHLSSLSTPDRQEYDFYGLGPREYKDECLSPKNAANDLYDFVVSGEASRGDERVRVKLLVYSRTTGHGIPLAPIEMPYNPDAEEWAANAGRVLASLTRVIQR